MSTLTKFVIASLLGLNLAGCGGVTNENVKERVITKADMDRYQDEQKKLAEMGVKGIGTPPQGSPNATTKTVR